MFKRRQSLSTAKRFQDFVWPRMGFARLWRYLVHRLGRMPGTPYSIAAGFACGAAASFTPLIGLHFIFAGLLAWGLRANILASAIGTVVGNPWTFPLIWLWIFKVGNWIIGVPEDGPPPQLSFEMIVGIFSGGNLSDGLHLLLPMIVGSVPSGIAVWFIVYFPLSRLIAGYQRRRALRRDRAAAARLPQGRVSEQGAINQ